ncbi:MAG: hypothetical protein ABJ382_06540, partial [Ilumatobacter sp.]
MKSASTLERPGAGDPAPSSTLRRPSFWARVGGTAYDHRGRVLVAWIAVLVAVFGSVGLIGASTESSFDTPDSESARGFEILQENFGSAGSFISGSLVFEAPAGIDDPEVVAAMTAIFEAVEDYDEV